MIPTSAHNEALAGDTLYSAFLNHEWRTIVLPFIIQGMAKIAAGIDDESDRQDFEVLYGAMIDDFYNEDVMDATPIGTIAFYPIHILPAKYIICDGAFLLQADYPDLYSVLGSVYGLASGTHFYVPNLVDKFALGAAGSGDMGATGGESEHTLTIAEIPVHNHTVSKGNGAGNSTTTVVEGDNVAPSTATINTGNRGGGDAHNNMPPYLKLIPMIKALP